MKRYWRPATRVEAFGDLAIGSMLILGMVTEPGCVGWWFIMAGLGGLVTILWGQECPTCKKKFETED